MIEKVGVDSVSDDRGRVIYFGSVFFVDFKNLIFVGF